MMRAIAKILARGRRVVLFVLPTVFVLLLLEAVVRITGADDRIEAYASSILYPMTVDRENAIFATRIFDPMLSWRLHPNAWLPHRIGRINSLGFVGKEFPRQKPPGKLRILTVGDSVTYGLWLCGALESCRRNPYPSALELLLMSRTGAEDVEVVNAGVYGYSSSQGARYYRNRLRKLDADVVTVMFGWNDFGASIGREGRDPQSPALAALSDAVFSSATFRTLVGAAAVLQRGVGGPVNPFPASFVPRVTLDEFDHTLDALVERIRRQGAVPVLVTEPMGPLTGPYLEGVVPQLWRLDGLESYAALVRVHDLYNDRVKEVARRNQVALVDAAAEFERRDKSQLFSPYDFVHPNEVGHALIAGLIYERLVQVGAVHLPRALAKDRRWRLGNEALLPEPTA